MVLTEKKCSPCEKGTKPLPPEKVREYLREIHGWQLLHNRTLRREFITKDFMEAVRLIQDISRIAEEENHHPDLHLTVYRRLAIELSTHSIGGLSENDFILAAKIDTLHKEKRKP